MIADLQYVISFGYVKNSSNLPGDYSFFFLLNTIKNAC